MPKLYHLSDLHVRNGINRLQEYRHVFENTLASIQTTYQPDDVCVITGDLLHDGVRLSAESLAETTAFINQLAKLMPVFVTPGNHDMGATKKRLTGLDLIMQFFPDNVTFLRDSGWHEHVTVLFKIISLLDDGDPGEKPASTKPVATLYHGIVKNARSSLGYSFPDGKSLDEIEGLGLLGDVHKYQSFKKGRVAYAGSLVQQNFGEDHDHGYLIWDLDTSTHTFVPVPSEYAFVTLESTDGLTLQPLDTTYAHPTYRLKVPAHTSAREVASLRQVLAQQKLPTNIPIIRERASTNENAADEPSPLANITTRDALLQYKPTLDAQVLALHDEYADKLTKDAPEPIRWKLRKLTVKNFLAIKEGTWDLTTYQPGAIVSLTGPNASGKSSTLGSILFALTGQTPRTRTAANLLRRGATKMSVSLEIAALNAVYTLTRTASTSKKSGKIVSKVKLFKDGEDISEKTSALTKVKVTKMFGTYEALTQTCFCMQQSSLGVLSLTNAERKRVLTNLLGLEQFNALLKMAKSDVTTVKAQLKECKNQRARLSGEELSQDLREDLQDQLSQLEMDRTVAQSSLESMQAQLLILLRTKPTATDPAQAKAKLVRLEAELAALPQDNLPKMLLLDTSDTTPIEDRQARVAKLEARIHKQPKPEKPWETYLKNVEKLRKADKKLFEAQARGDPSTLAKVQRVQAAQNKTNAQREVVAQQQAAWDQTESLRTSVATESKKLEKHIAKQREKTLKLQGQVAVLVRKIGHDEARQEQEKALDARIQTLEQKLALLSEYVQYVHINGVPSFLLNRAVPCIERETNAILQSIVDFRIESIVTDKAWSLTRVREDQRVALECASGFEMRIAALALRLALRAVSRTPCPDGIVIDEGFASADQHHRRQLPSVFDTLRQRVGWTLVISHMEELMHAGDHIFALHRTEADDASTFEV